MLQEIFAPFGLIYGYLLCSNRYLATLIPHWRTYGLFEEYAPPVTIYYAHLAHAIGDTDSAETCYHIAANLDGAGAVWSNVPRVDL